MRSNEKETRRIGRKGRRSKERKGKESKEGRKWIMGNKVGKIGKSKDGGKMRRKEGK